MRDPFFALGSMGWFISQTIAVGGLGAIYFWLPLTIGIALMFRSYRLSRATDKRKLWLLAILPIPWLAVGFWGALFWRSDEARSPPEPWVLWPAALGLPVFIALAIWLIIYLRDYRALAAIFAAMNLYPMLSMSLLASMAISGTWL